MRETLKRLRTIALVLTLAVACYDRAAILGAASVPYPACGEICPDSSCETRCETWVGDLMWFPTCGEYGVCNDAVCGDGICQNGEDFINCPDDCIPPGPPPPPPPPPPSGVPPSNVVLVHGANTEGEWTQPGTNMYNAVQATYSESNLFPWPWTNNSISEVMPPFYGGIYDGAIALASFIEQLPPGNVQIVSHSHGGNVAIRSTFWTTRQIKHMTNLATPINMDMSWRGDYRPNTVRCTASSWADFVQFLGASPTQIWGFALATWQSVAAAHHALDNLFEQGWDSEEFVSQALLSLYWAYLAYEWWESTKIEWEGTTYTFHGLSHEDMHEPNVWNAIAHCATFPNG